MIETQKSEGQGNTAAELAAKYHCGSCCSKQTGYHVSNTGSSTDRLPSPTQESQPPSPYGIIATIRDPPSRCRFSMYGLTARGARQSRTVDGRQKHYARSDKSAMQSALALQQPPQQSGSEEWITPDLESDWTLAEFDTPSLTNPSTASASSTSSWDVEVADLSTILRDRMTSEKKTLDAVWNEIITGKVNETRCI